MSTDRRPVRLSARRTVVSLLGSLAVAPAFFLCGWLYFQSTDFVYGPLTYEANAGLVRTIRWSVFGGLTLVLLGVIAWFKIWRPHHGNKPLSLLILLPLAAFVAFSSWIFGILVFGLLITVLVFSQIYVVVVRDELRRPPSGWGNGPDRLATLRFLLLAAAVGLGIWFMITARSWAYRSRQLEEIHRKELISQPGSLQELAEGNHKEYVLLALPNLRVDYTVNRTFGSGDNSYTLEYGALTDRVLDRQAALEWKIWVYMPAFYDEKQFPMIFQTMRCTVGADCPANFVKMHDSVIRQHFRASYKEVGSDTQIARPGQVLLELTPEPDLVIGDQVWREKLQWRGGLLLLLQALYALTHLAELLAIRWRLKLTYQEN